MSKISNRERLRRVVEEHIARIEANEPDLVVLTSACYVSWKYRIGFISVRDGRHNEIRVFHLRKNGNLEITRFPVPKTYISKVDNNTGTVLVADASSLTVVSSDDPVDHQAWFKFKLKEDREGSVSFLLEETTLCHPLKLTVYGHYSNAHRALFKSITDEVIC